MTLLLVEIGPDGFTEPMTSVSVGLPPSWLPFMCITNVVFEY